MNCNLHTYISFEKSSSWQKFHDVSVKQEGQVALDRSPVLCLNNWKLTTRPPDKSMNYYFSHSSTKTYVVGTQNNRLN